LPFLLETPSHLNQRGIFTTSAPFLFGPIPDWANDFDESQFPRFDPNPSAPFPLPLQTAGFLGNPGAGVPPFALPEVTIEGPGNFAGVAGYDTGSSTDNSAMVPSWDAPAQPSAHVPSYTDLRETVLQTLPPPPTTVRLNVSTTLQLTPIEIYEPAVTASPHMSSIDEPSSRGHSMAPAPASTPGFGMDGLPLPGHPPPQFQHMTYQPRQVLRQSHFVYDQVMFIHLMTKRWHWSLVAEDAFPINIFPARGACVMYAEQVLEVMRPTHNITQRMFDYVSEIVLRCWTG
jgi:hypothetical protein